MQQIEKEQQVKVQEAEIMRREKELIATVLKQAEIERQRIETLAEAEKPAPDDGSRRPRRAIRAQGEAEAEIIFKKGEAEAKAMNVKAEAYQEYNQAAVVDKLITGMPEIVRALASSAGQGRQDHHRLHRQRHAAGHAQDHRRHHGNGGAGPALFEALSGMKMQELLGKVRTIGDKRRSRTPATVAEAESVESAGGGKSRGLAAWAVSEQASAG